MLEDFLMNLLDNEVGQKAETAVFIQLLYICCKIL